MTTNRRSLACILAVSLFLSCTAGTGAYVPSADVNSDGSVDVRDFQSAIQSVFADNSPDGLSVLKLQQILGLTERPAPKTPAAPDAILAGSCVAPNPNAGSKHYCAPVQPPGTLLVSSAQQTLLFEAGADVPAPAASRYLYLLTPHAPPRRA